jgi:hypothetical protein
VATVYPWTIHDRLPTLLVPLDLQDASATVYDRARYDRSLNYDADLQPPLCDDDAVWVRELLQSREPQCP